MFNLLDDVLEIEVPLTESEIDILYPEDSPESSPESDEPDPDNPQADPQESDKLSDLLRRNTLPQIQKQLVKFEGNTVCNYEGYESPVVAVCALGALTMETGGRDALIDCLPASDVIGAYTGVDMEMLVKNPRSGNLGVLFEVIIELNDELQWSFTQIADWLQSIGL